MTVQYPGGGGGGSSSGGYYNPNYAYTDPRHYDITGGTYTSGGYLTLGTSTNITTTGCLVVPDGRSRLSPEQLAFLLAEHGFMDDGGEYCLFCVALDVYRTRRDHMYVICEE